MAIEYTLRKLAELVLNLKDRILELESEHGEIHGMHFGTSFPSSPYPNQIVVRTDETPPAGGTMYRWDSTSSTWLVL